jgi:23S rRNA pseudouridine1911/1915/1917 synthase
MYIREVIRSEKCEVNGKIENKGKRVRAGDFIEIELEFDRETAMRAEKIPLEILFEDQQLIAVNKPAGMLVHPSHRQKRSTLLNALSFHLNQGSKKVRPGLVHRLDRETSGVMLVAKDLKTHRSLSRQFQKKTVEKLYLAMVEGSIKSAAGVIEAPIGRFAEEKRWGVKTDGNYAVTNYRVVGYAADVSLLELQPVTGRTNQLRIHCESIGHPIVGDVRRGGREFERLCLHAWRLSFDHPATHERISLEAAPPNWVRAQIP